MKTERLINEHPAGRRDPNIDARLALLLETTPRGRELSLREIAAAVGCSWQLIWRIEQNAMRKLRQRLEHPAMRKARARI